MSRVFADDLDLIEGRIKFMEDEGYKESVSDYYHALQTAKAAIEKQMYLADVISDLQSFPDDATFSKSAMLETLWDLWAGELPPEYKYLKGL